MKKTTAADEKKAFAGAGGNEGKQARGKALRAGVLIVDDHPVVREGLARYIDSQPDMRTWGQASFRAEIVAKLQESLPDLVLMDISLEDCDGIEMIRDIKRAWPSLPVLVISMHDEMTYAARALGAGASGYIMKGEERSSILRAIREVLNGKMWFSQSVQRQLVETMRGQKQAEPPLSRLTDREIEVMRLIGEGKTTQGIADMLRISPKTVETHRLHLKAKLKVHSLAELMRMAISLAEGRDGKFGARPPV